MAAPSSKNNAFLVGGVVAVLLVVLAVFLLRGNGGEAPPLAPGGAVAEEPAGAPGDGSTANTSSRFSGGGEGADRATLASADGAEGAPPPRDNTRRGPQWTGQVLDAQTNAPIAGARLMVLRNSQALGTPRLPLIAHEARSADDGTFTVPADPTRGLAQLESLRVEAEGYASFIRIVPAPRGDGARRVVFRLPPGEQITGSVVDTADAPVPMAQVGFVILEDFSPLELASGAPRTVVSAYVQTDESGAFALKGLRGGLSYRLPVRAEGYLAHVTEPEPAGAQGLRIVLERGTSALAGVVQEADGKPVEGAFVSLAPTGPQRALLLRSTMDLMLSAREVTTTADGRFEFKGLGAGGHELVASMERRVPNVPSGGKVVTEGVTLKPDETTEVVLQFLAPIVITGRAYDKATGEGVAGVRVSTEPYQSNPVLAGLMPDMRSIPRASEAVTAADGLFELPVDVSDAGMMQLASFYFEAPAGWVATSNVNPGWQNTPGMGMLMGPEPGSAQPVEIVLTKGVERPGIVLEPDGQTPASGATVTLQLGRNSSLVEITDAEGRFSFTAEVNQRAMLEVTHEKGFGGGEIVFDPEATAPLEVVLAGAGTISGNVRDSAGRPVPDAEVFFSTGEQGGRGRGGRGGVRGGILGALVPVRTDAEGYFFREGLKAGTYTVRAQPPAESLLAEGESEPLELAEGQDLRGVEIILGGGSFIDGVVLESRTGEPIAGVEVSTFDPGRGPALPDVILTDAEGYFRVEGLEENDRVGVLNFRKDGHSNETRRNVRPQESPLVVEMDAQRSYIVEAYKLGSGAPVTKYSVQVASSGGRQPQGGWWGGGSPATIIESPDGRGELDGVGAGNHRVTVSEIEGDVPTGNHGSMDINADELEDGATIRVPVRQGQAVSGRVVLAGTEDGVAGALVTLEPRGRRPWGQQSTPSIPPVAADDEGNFRIGGVAPGEYRATAALEGYTARDGGANVTVPEDGGVEGVLIQLDASGVLTGLVTGLDGAPHAGADIQVSGSGPRLQVVSGPDGRYRFENVPPGNRRVTATLSPDTQQSETFEMTAGGEVTKDFDFSGFVRLTGTITPQPGADRLPNLVALLGPDGQVYPLNWNGFSYATSVPPGEHTIIGEGGARDSVQPGPAFTIAPSPREQVLPINLPHLPIQASYDLPDGASLPRGRATIEGDSWSGELRVGGGGGWRNATLYGFPGQYTASYRSDNGEWIGASLPTPIAPGAPNALTIVVGPAQ